MRKFFYSCLFFLSLVLFFLSVNNKANFIYDFFQNIFFNLKFNSASQKTSEIDVLKNENLKFKTETAELIFLKNDNQALRDQFRISYPAPSDLTQSKIIGFPTDLNNISYFIIDKGYKSGIKKGASVIYLNNFLGTISRINNYYSKVKTIFDNNFFISAQDAQTKTYGIIKNENSEIIFDNVLTSDKLKIGDTIITSPTKNFKGDGVPPDLVIGKIISIYKNPSSLFQKALINPILDFKNLEIVFILN